MNKKGDEKYYWIISLIIGIMVMGIIIYMVFQNYFTNNETDWQVCRESVLVRDGQFANGLKLIQDALPLKCKTQVININFKDTERAMKLIADTAARCWYTYGEGNANIFPVEFASFSSTNERFFVCARIHYDYSVKTYYQTELQRAQESYATNPDGTIKMDEYGLPVAKNPDLSGSPINSCPLVYMTTKTIANSNETYADYIMGKGYGGLLGSFWKFSDGTSIPFDNCNSNLNNGDYFITLALISNPYLHLDWKYLSGYGFFRDLMTDKTYRWILAYNQGTDFINKCTSTSSCSMETIPA